MINTRKGDRDIKSFLSHRFHLPLGRLSKKEHEDMKEPGSGNNFQNGIRDKSMKGEFFLNSHRGFSFGGMGKRGTDNNVSYKKLMDATGFKHEKDGKHCNGCKNNLNFEKIGINRVEVLDGTEGFNSGTLMEGDNEYLSRRRNDIHWIIEST